MAKKFLNFAKLLGVQKFALEASPWLMPCGQWLNLVETTSQVYPSLQDAQNSRAWLDTAHWRPSLHCHPHFQKNKGR